MITTLDAARSGTFTLGGEVSVRRLGFGAMRLTGPAVWGPPVHRAEAIATLRRSVELGITLIDTAESYGPHVSESLIAEALYPYPSELVIATKGGFDRPTAKRWDVNCRPARLREELEGSLRRLRVDCIHLYQLHRIDATVPMDEQFGFLQNAQREGKIRWIGLSEVSIDQIRGARQFFQVVSVQNRYNLIDRAWDAVVDYCELERIAFLPWAPLASGRLAGGGVRRYIRQLIGHPPGSAAITRVAKRHGATPSQIALAWLLRRSPVILPIPGTSTRSHLEENVAATNIELSPDEFAALRQIPGSSPDC